MDTFELQDFNKRIGLNSELKMDKGTLFMSIGFKSFLQVLCVMFEILVNSEK